MADTQLDLDDAVHLTRTGDVWLFRGSTVADRTIRITTNSPINHVGMSVVIEDLPPLMWHAELGRALTDMWTGGRHRGVQLHDLREAVELWTTRYKQRAWLRQLEPPVTREQEDAVLKTVARLDGTPFPSTTRLLSRWLYGRVPRLPKRSRTSRTSTKSGKPEGTLETAYCAEVVAITYQAMGLLPATRKPTWYDPGRFWSGDELSLDAGLRLGDEIAISPGVRA
ncbi:hypothetical protein [Actinophytocola sp.]|uniref:hypothetical protein n=1 Tax=Actinophytocola sp. TaxID=1872138 RepID=UPI003D6BA2E2